MYPPPWKYIELCGGWWQVCYAKKSPLAILAWNVSPNTGLNGLSISENNREKVKIKTTNNLILSTLSSGGSLNNSGAEPKLLQ